MKFSGKITIVIIGLLCVSIALFVASCEPSSLYVASTEVVEESTQEKFIIKEGVEFKGKKTYHLFRASAPEKEIAWTMVAWHEMIGADKEEHVITLYKTTGGTNEYGGTEKGEPLFLYDLKTNQLTKIQK